MIHVGVGVEKNIRNVIIQTKIMVDKVKLKYDKNDSWGIMVSVDLHGCNPEFIRDRNKIRQFVIDLCKLISVIRFGECIIVNFGKEKRVQGFSMAQLIDSSLISGHFANQTNSAYLDIFSCKYYNPKEIAKFAEDYFQAKSCKINYLLRI